MIHLLAVEVGLQSIVTGLVGAALAGTAVFGLIGQRTKEISATYKALYEAKVAENAEQDQRIAALEAQVRLMTSHFVQEIARGVSRAFIEMEDQRRDR